MLKLFFISMVFPFLFFYKLLFFRLEWEHWDLNPDRRVSSQVIAPVNHHYSDDPLLIIPVTGARNDAGLHHAPFLFTSSSSVLVFRVACVSFAISSAFFLFSSSLVNCVSFFLFPRLFVVCRKITSRI